MQEFHLLPFYETAEAFGQAVGEDTTYWTRQGRKPSFFVGLSTHGGIGGRINCEERGIYMAMQILSPRRGKDGQVVGNDWRVWIDDCDDGRMQKSCDTREEAEELIKTVHQYAPISMWELAEVLNFEWVS